MDPKPPQAYLKSLGTDYMDPSIRRTHTANTLIHCIIGAIMVGLGYTNLENCNNGATSYLYYAGIFLLSCNLPGLVIVCAQEVRQTKQWWTGQRTPAPLPTTTQDEDATSTTSRPESWGEKIVHIGNLILFLADIIALLWGSIVVFQAYSKWTYVLTDIPLDDGKTDVLNNNDTDVQNYCVLNPNDCIPNPNYCAYTPFITAFVLLIIEWTWIPALICVGVVCPFCAVFWACFLYG